MSEETAAPPMSGDSLPLKELKPEPAKQKQPRSKNWRVYGLAGLLVLIFFVGGITLGFYIERQRKEKAVILPSPSPSPSPILRPSPSPVVVSGLEAQIQEFADQLDQVDLEEEQLVPPALDYDIRFKKK